MKHSRVLLGLIALLGLVSGCNIPSVTTVVYNDGSYRRIDSWTEERAGKISGLMQGFALPKGEGWKVSRKITPLDKGSRRQWMRQEGVRETYTAERKLKEGEELVGDISIKAAKDKKLPPIVVNSVTVQRLSPTRIEYREIWEWRGPKSDIDVIRKQSLKDAELFAILKRKLPANLFTPETASKLQDALLHRLWRYFFGRVVEEMQESQNQEMQNKGAPNWKNEEIAREIAKKKAFQVSSALLIERALETTFKDDLTAAQRKEIAKPSSVEYMKLAYSGQGAQTRHDPAMLVAYTLKMPGRVVETNGTRLSRKFLTKAGGGKPGKFAKKDMSHSLGDDFSAEVTVGDAVSGRVVVWGVISTAAMLEPVELRAVCEVKP